MEAVGLPTFEVREDKGNRIDWLVPTRTYYGSANMMSIDGQSLTAADPFALVASLNEHRRHLTPSQLAMVAAKRANMKQGRGPTSNLLHRCRRLVRAQAAKALKVSTREASKATAVRKKASADVIEKVEKGKMTLKAAERTIRRPASKQPKPKQTDLEEFTEPSRNAPKAESRIRAA